LARQAARQAGLRRVLWCPQAGPSGTGIGFIDPMGENCIAVAPGANWRLGTADVIAGGARIAAAQLVTAQFEIPDAPILAAFGLARAHGVRTLLNPSPWR